MLAAKFPHGEPQLFTNTRSPGSTHLNTAMKPSVRLGHEPELEAPALLLLDPNSHILGIRRIPAAIRPTPSYKA